MVRMAAVLSPHLRTGRAGLSRFIVLGQAQRSGARPRRGRIQLLVASVNQHYCLRLVAVDVGQWNSVSKSRRGLMTAGRRRLGSGRSVGCRLVVLPKLRQQEYPSAPREPARGRLLLRAMWRPIRTEEPEETLRRQGGRRRLQDHVRAPGISEQPQLPAAPIRPSDDIGCECLRHPKALLRTGDHRAQETASVDSPTGRMDWLQHPSRSGSGFRADFRRTRPGSRAEGVRARQMEEDFIPKRSAHRSTRMADRSHELHRIAPIHRIFAF